MKKHGKMKGRLPNLNCGDNIIVRCPKRSTCDYLTAGKEYEAMVTSAYPEQAFFKLISDYDKEILCMLKSCPHLDVGMNWQYLRKVLPKIKLPRYTTVK